MEALKEDNKKMLIVADDIAVSVDDAVIVVVVGFCRGSVVGVKAGAVPARGRGVPHRLKHPRLGGLQPAGHGVRGDG